jgi:hypothetical protein
LLKGESARRPGRRSTPSGGVVEVLREIVATVGLNAARARAATTTERESEEGNADRPEKAVFTKLKS